MKKMVQAATKLFSFIKEKTFRKHKGCRCNLGAPSAFGRLAKENRMENPRKIKAQAATEFLMTYGWALLLIFIAMGALYYMGIFEPAVAEKCIPKSPFGACSLKITEGSGAVNEIAVAWSERALSSSPGLVSVAIEGRPECSGAGLNVVSSCPRCRIVGGSGTCTLNAGKTGCVATGGASCAFDSNYLCTSGVKQSFTCNHGLKKKQNYRGIITLQYAGESELSHNIDLEVSGVVQ